MLKSSKKIAKEKSRRYVDDDGEMHHRGHFDEYKQICEYGDGELVDASEFTGDEVTGWMNCECLFSVLLVGILVALPFNLHTKGT